MLDGQHRGNGFENNNEMHNKLCKIRRIFHIPLFFIAMV
jgi:hypothetical protein